MTRATPQDPCQVAYAGTALPCKAREGGGLRCERLDPHGDDGHRISDHTIRHKLAGNGYACVALETPAT